MQSTQTQDPVAQAAVAVSARTSRGTGRAPWLIVGLASAFAIAGVAASTIDAQAQQRRPAAKSTAKKAPAKKAPARKATGKKTVKKAVPKVVPVPAPPPGVTLAPGANTVGAHASLYLGFLNDARTLKVAEANSGPAITRLTERAARHLNSERLAIGMVAYGAAHAATDNQFVEEARKAAAYYGRDAFIAKMRTEYAWPRTLPGADRALELGVRAVLADQAGIEANAATFKSAAYTLQRQSWANVRIGDSAARNLALTNLVPPLPLPAPAVTYSALPEATLTPEATFTRSSALKAAAFATSEAERVAVTMPASIAAWSAADRMLATAALMAIGAPADKQADVEFVMRDPRLVSCVNAARLNLRMCNAATRQGYERVFCLAEHPMGEAGRCLSRLAR